MDREDQLNTPFSLAHSPILAREPLSHKEFKNEKWRGREFKSTNGKGAKFSDCDFAYSIFDNSYFRDAEFKNCQFTGAKFFDCNLKGAKFILCDLQYVQFHRSLLDIREVVAAIPVGPNLRRDSLQNLRANASEVGDYPSQRFLVLEEIDATKKHLKNIIWPPDTYYRQKYPDFLPKLEAGWSLFWLQLSGFVWGNGERPRNIIVSGAFFLLLLTLVNFWSVYQHVSWQESLAGLKILQYTISLFLDLGVDKKYQGFVLVDYAIAVMRYLYIGLYISVLYRKISHR